MIICEIWIQTRDFAVASGLTQEITEKALCFKNVNNFVNINLKIWKLRLFDSYDSSLQDAVFIVSNNFVVRKLWRKTPVANLSWMDSKLYMDNLDVEEDSREPISLSIVQL